MRGDIGLIATDLMGWLSGCRVTASPSLLWLFSLILIDERKAAKVEWRIRNAVLERCIAGKTDVLERLSERVDVDNGESGVHSITHEDDVGMWVVNF